MTNFEQEMEDEFGDPRRCPVHPSQITSSADGMCDAPCAFCEAAMDKPWLVERVEAGVETAADIAFINAEFADAAREARRSRWAGVRR